MAHVWEPYGEYKDRPNERDVVRTVECRECHLRAAQTVSSGEILGGLLEVLPDCETLYVRQVLET